jgi:outer membrane protein, heavy metal efflux system
MKTPASLVGVAGAASRVLRSTLIAAALAGITSSALAETLTWEQVKGRFEVANPTLIAARLNIDESRAAEITAYLRPNPDFTTFTDQIDPFQVNPYRPLQYAFPSVAFSYLHERQHKRELRQQQAKESTAIADSSYTDQERGLLFTLRNAFVLTLQAKAVLQNARDNLAYWDKELEIDEGRLHAGDIAQLDMNRLKLQRVQFESDYETAMVAVRTNKIQLLQLMNDRRSLEQFDITGPFDFSERLPPLEELRNIALETRPDLKVAAKNIELARITYKLAVANGTADPTFGVDFARNPPISAYFGFSVSIPLRIFDRNQGEKARTKIDIGRNERLFDAARAQVFNDVEAAYYTVMSNLNLLKPYRAAYLALAVDTRNKMRLSYLNGGNSLLDYLDAEKALRDTRLAYLNLVGAYLVAAAQLDMAVGREVVLL